MKEVRTGQRWAAWVSQVKSRTTWYKHMQTCHIGLLLMAKRLLKRTRWKISVLLMISTLLDSKFCLFQLIAVHSGVCLLGNDDIVPLNDVVPEKNGVKVVMGPGTGLGEAFLCKSQFSKCHEVFPAEGGHTEWSPRGDIDFKLYRFAKNYIATSQNVENLKTPNVTLDRLSVERVCAGPALPMIYEFMKTEHPDL